MPSTPLPTAKPRGPSAKPKWPPSLASDNPYNFTPALLQAAKLPVKIADKYFFFFGYEGDQPEVCLQQWFPAPFAGPKNNITEPGNGDTVDFATSEHIMMYQKALLMKDVRTAQRILAAGHPSEAKKLGREAKNFYRSDERNADLREALLDTGEREIVEASPDDRIWGIGFDSESAEGSEAE